MPFFCSLPVTVINCFIAQICIVLCSLLYTIGGKQAVKKIELYCDGLYFCNMICTWLFVLPFLQGSQVLSHNPEIAALQDFWLALLPVEHKFSSSLAQFPVGVLQFLFVLAKSQIP